MSNIIIEGHSKSGCDRVSKLVVSTQEFHSKSLPFHVGDSLLTPERTTTTFLRFIIEFNPYWGRTFPTGDITRILVVIDGFSIFINSPGAIFVSLMGRCIL